MAIIYWLAAVTVLVTWRHFGESQNPYLSCPFHDDDPCECSMRPESVSIVCRYVENGDILGQMLNKARNSNLTGVGTLFLFRSNVTLPYPHLFDGLPFKKLYITESRVNAPAEQSAESLQPLIRGLEETVEEVHFRNSTIRFVEESCVLGSLPQLRRLSLVAAEVTTIPSTFFCCSYTKLEEVFLNQNNVSALNKGVLSRAMLLSIVMLNHNRISVVERLFFPSPAENLKELHLRYNSLQTLPNDMFTKMPNLKFVDCAHNHLKFLPETLWKPVWTQLLDIYLDSNELQCDCSMEWLPYQETLMGSKFKHDRMLSGRCNSTYNNSLVELEKLDMDELIC